MIEGVLCPQTQSINGSLKGSSAMRILHYGFILFFLLVVFSGCALNKDLKRLERQVTQIDVNFQRMNDEMATQRARDNSLRDQYAGQGAEFYQLKEEVSRLKGRLDELEYKIDQTLKANTDAIAKGEARLKHLEGFMGIDPTAAGPSPATAPPGAALEGSMQNAGNIGGEMVGGNAQVAEAAEASEANIYNIAKNAYDREDYETARQGFEAFIKQFPKSKEADNARFWIGESYFKERWYQKAILEYQEVIEKYPKGNKAPSAYLKQGLAFEQLGEQTNARLVFQELIRQFPNSGEANVAKQKLSQLK